MAFKLHELKVKVTFLEEILGTSTGDVDVYREYIGSKAPDAETMEQEIARLGKEAVEEKGKTVFHKENGQPILYGYQVRGFFKAAGSACAKIPGSKSKSLKAFKKTVDTLVFIKEEFVPIENFDKIGECQRPLRANTPQGERVSIAISESIPRGATATFTVQVFDEAHFEYVKEWLDYGFFNGFGQWRNSGKGRFTYEILEQD